MSWIQLTMDKLNFGLFLGEKKVFGQKFHGTFLSPVGSPLIS